MAGHRFNWKRTYEKVNKEASLDEYDLCVLRFLMDKSFLFGKKKELKEQLLIKLFCKKDPDEEEMFTKKCALRTLEKRIFVERSLKRVRHSALHALEVWGISVTIVLLLLVLSVGTDTLVNAANLRMNFIILTGLLAFFSTIPNIIINKSHGSTIGYLLGLYLLTSRMDDIMQFTIDGYLKYCFGWLIIVLTYTVTISALFACYEANTKVYLFIIDEFMKKPDEEEINVKESSTENKETSKTNKKYMLETEELVVKVKDYPELKQVLHCFDANEKFNYLLAMKETVPENLYAYYLRAAFQMDTRNASLELLLSVFKDVDRNLLMSEEEMKRYDELPEYITIYRGTKPDEVVPRLSWSLKESVAEKYNQGRLFKATIRKDTIIAYFSNNTFEEEIVAYVPENFEIIS